MIHSEKEIRHYKDFYSIDEPENLIIYEPIDMLSKNFPHWGKVYNQLKNLKKENKHILEGPYVLILLWMLRHAQREDSLSISYPLLKKFLKGNGYELGSGTYLRKKEAVFKAIFNDALGLKDEALCTKLNDLWIMSLELREILRQGPSPTVANGIRAFESIHKKAREESSFYLDKLKSNSVYIPGAYTGRSEIETQIQDFLQPDCEKTGFLLVGPSGMGKTNTIANIVDKLLKEEDIVLFIPLKCRSFEDTTLKNVVCEKLDVDSKFSGFLKDFDKSRGSDAKSPALIFVFDGVNEVSGKMIEIYKEINQIIDDNRKYDWVKVIYSCRDTIYHNLKEESGIEPDEATHFTIEGRNGGKEKESPEIHIRGFSDSELENAYEKYRKIDGKSPTSNFAEIPDDTRKLMTHPNFTPYHLRMLLESYDGEKIPSVVNLDKFFEKFCEKKIFGRMAQDRAEIINHLVDTFRESKTTSLSSEIVEKKDYIEQSLKTYFQLIDDKVLIKSEVNDTVAIFEKKTKVVVEFFNDELFEYLLSKRIEQTDASLERLLKLSVEAIEYPQLEKALVKLFQRFLYSGKIHTITQFLLNDEKGIAPRIISEVIASALNDSLTGDGLFLANELYPHFHRLDYIPYIVWNAYISQGRTYKGKAEYEKAEMFFNKVIDHMEHNEIDLFDLDKLVVAYGSLADLYDRWGNEIKAEELRQKMLTLSDRIDSDYNYNDADPAEVVLGEYGYYGIGCNFLENGEIKEAEVCFHKSIEICGIHKGGEICAAAFGRLGLLYHSMGATEEAEKFLGECISCNIAWLEKEIVRLLDAWRYNQESSVKGLKIRRLYLKLSRHADFRNILVQSFNKLNETALYYWDEHVQIEGEDRDRDEESLKKSLDITEFLIDNNYFSKEAEYEMLRGACDNENFPTKSSIAGQRKILSSHYKKIDKLLRHILQAYPENQRARNLLRKLKRELTDQHKIAYFPTNDIKV
jgi:tetratricopeptide (TPR) repeat protein